MADQPEGKSILFVCKGNICRSPFAERLFVQLAGEQTRANVSSTGHYPVPDRTSPEKAIRAAREYNVDLSDHRSRVLTEDQLRRADRILVMDRTNAKACKKQGIDPSRITDLSKFHPDMREGQQIMDPYRSPYSEYVSCFDRIHRAVRGLIEKQK